MDKIDSCPSLSEILRLQLAIFLLLLLVSPSFLEADLEIFGYYENRFFLLSQKNSTSFSEKFSLGDYNRLRLQLKSSLEERVSLNAAVDFFTFHGVIEGPLGTQRYYEQANDTQTHIDLDRAYIDFYFPGFDLTVGKQRVAIGVSYLWAPLDLFNRVNIFEPKEEKPGVNAFKIYVPLGEFSSLTGVFSPEENFKYSKYGIRAQTHLKGVDMAVSIIRFARKKQTIYGIDLRGENVVGWWVEGGYFLSPDEKDMKIVIGFDYTIPYKGGIYWLNEFFFDESGEKDIAFYDYNQLLSGDRFTLARTYYFSSLSYPFTGFVSGSITYIGNWTDGSYILSPGLRYELAQNVSLNGGFFFLLGKKGGEFNREGASDILFVWFKIHF